MNYTVTNVLLLSLQYKERVTNNFIKYIEGLLDKQNTNF